MDTEDELHDQETCPHCLALQAMGQLAESLQAMLDSGYFHALGERMAYERERRAIDGILGHALPDRWSGPVRDVDGQS